MGEPSLWNRLLRYIAGENNYVSTPHGRAVPLEPTTQESCKIKSKCVSTPHGRAVPLELVTSQETTTLVYGFNPSWESRPSGTDGQGSQDYLAKKFQPLMGEPSLWNIALYAIWSFVVPCFNPSWESRPSGT